MINWISNLRLQRCRACLDSVFGQKEENSQTNAAKINQITCGWKKKSTEDHCYKRFHLPLSTCLCLHLPVIPSLLPSLPLSISPPFVVLPIRIMTFVALSLILSWASLGASTATAVVREKILIQRCLPCVCRFTQSHSLTWLKPLKVHYVRIGCLEFIRPTK